MRYGVYRHHVSHILGRYQHALWFDLITFAFFTACIACPFLFDVVDYFVVNVSSPNTPNLRDLQEKEPLTALLKALKVENALLANKYAQKPKPFLLKIAPDLTEDQLLDIIAIIHETQIDGVIATNTTLDKSAVSDSPHAEEMGGLSGAPLTQQSTLIIQQLRAHLGSDMPIIGVGGIQQGSDAIEKLAAGANLVQVYSGFIYRGPALITDIRKAVAAHHALA